MSPRAVAVLALALAACPGDDGPEPLFPADYDADYAEVRNCRPSGDHDLNNIRILADPDAAALYQSRGAPFPAGAVVLKEEYEFDDLDCAGPIKQWTVMVRRATGSAPDLLDWSWQRVDAARRVVGEDEPRCVQCHKGCGGPPDGFDGTCAMP